MALQLSKTGINTSSSILAWHVTQSVDAFTGIKPYNINLSGSLAITGSKLDFEFTSTPNNLTSSFNVLGVVESFRQGGYVDVKLGDYWNSSPLGVGNYISIINSGTYKQISLNGQSAPIYITGPSIELNDASYAGNIAQIKLNGPVTASGDINANGTVYMSTASVGGGLFTSASLAAGGSGGTTVIGNPGGTGANLTTINIGGTVYEVSGSSGGSSFPYTGSAIISGSLKTIGVAAFHLDGQFDLTSSITVTATSPTSNNRYASQSPANVYYLNGIEAPYINFYPGKSYIFDWSGAPSHPVAFYLDAAKNTQYTTGVSTPASNQTQIDVTEDTPSILYYMCTAHPYMGNASHLQGGGNDYNNIQTHTANFTSSATYNGKYNVVGGNLAIAVDTSSADLTTGMEWDFFQSSSGDTFEFVPKTGVTLISKNNHKKLAAQGSAASLKYISGQTFHLVGDLTL